MEQKFKKTYTPQTALPKIMAFCAYRERTFQEVRDKLYEYGLNQREVEEMLVHLSKEKFIDEERYAKAYSGGKFRIKKWGKNKILQNLKFDGLSDYNIRKAMTEINETDYKETLEILLRKKLPTIKENNPYIKKQKLARFAIGKGYEPDLVWSMIEKIA